MSVLIVFTTFPEETAAHETAQAVIRSQLAACCQVGAPVRSYYRWNGTVEETVEIPLTCKTTVAAWPALEDFLKSRHPYELPEIIAIPVTHGLPAYLSWVATSMGKLPGQ